MMKERGQEKLVLLTNRVEIAAMYMGELQSIFGRWLDLTGYSIEAGAAESMAIRAEVAAADILLVTSTDIFENMRPYVSESCRIIMLQYGFLKEKIEYLKAFPQNTSALVCFNYHHISAKIVSMLYEHGLQNMDLQAYKIGQPLEGKHYDIAIVGDNSAIVPEGISQIVSLGMRKLSPSTLLAIATAADILTENLENTIRDYCKDIYTEDKSLSRVYDIFSVNKIQLKTIMNCIDYAICICDGEFRILDFNDNLKSMFGIRKNISRLSLRAIPELHDIAAQVMAEEPAKNVLVSTAGKKSFLVSREDISSAWEAGEYHIVLIKDVTKILTLELSFKKQLAQRGHVTKYSFDSILGKSQAILACVDRAKKIARLDKPTLIIGESGTGKELFAQSIHSASPRGAYPFLALNCAALPATLLESELFGYSDGAFTGAKKGGHTGLFEQVNKGTFFLDEIGEISLETQAKLLRVLEEREIMRVGSGEIVPIDVRVIAATNKNLRELVREGKFRMDLYYRLNTLELHIPPVRERKEDIPLLIRHVLESENLPHVTISREAMDFFMNFSWEGNVREMRNCVEYMAQISDGHITLEHLPRYILEEYGETLRRSPTNLQSQVDQRDRALAKEILQLVSQREMGRVAVLEDLRRRHPDVSDYHLRRLIDLLRGENLLMVHKGRRGMAVTPLGAKLLAD